MKDCLARLRLFGHDRLSDDTGGRCLRNKGYPASPYTLVLYSLAQLFSDCVGISWIFEDCKLICRNVSSSGISSGRWGQEMFCKCGAEEWTSRNCPVFCVWTYIVLCVTDLSQICVPECIGPGLQPDCDQSIILVESN